MGMPTYCEADHIYNPDNLETGDFKRPQYSVVPLTVNKTGSVYLTILDEPLRAQTLIAETTIGRQVNAKSTQF